jgi:membrane protease YdiL (CAAX protease family)
MQTQTEMPPPIGLAPSAAMFGAFSILLWLTVAVIIPWLRDTSGISPIIGWYLSGTAFVLMPLLIFGVLMAWRELPAPSLDALRTRLRVHRLDRGDIIWSIGGLFVITIATAAVLMLARIIDPTFRPAPWFLSEPPGWHAQLFAAWIPLFVSNILGEELCWRGYLLPRQEAAWGHLAWLPNGILWCLFHFSFGWPIMVTLLPITLLLPWIVQRRQNTSVGLLIHGLFNAAGFIAATSGVGASDG